MSPSIIIRAAVALLLVHSGPAPAQESIPLRDGLALGRLAPAGRQPFFTDPVAHAITLGDWRTPSAGDTVRVGERDATWDQVHAGEDGAIRGRDAAGYVLFTVERAHAATMILDARGHSMVYVNGEPRAGDPYSNGLLRVPVHLRLGTNELLFKGGRGQLRAQLVEPEAPVAFDTEDFTLPDQIEGEEGDLWAAVPLLNATTDTASNLTVRATCPTPGGEPPLTTPVASIPPLGVHKAPVRVPRAGADAEGNVRLTLELVRDGAVLHTREITIHARSAHEKHVRTFVSGIDGSVQYFAVTPQRRPAEGEFRDERPALFLTLHGASVEARGQAGAYDHKLSGHIVAPTNRRPFGFDWEDWGRLDALEVLDIASDLFDADPDRTYLTGHSMGGHGAWQIGAHFPGRFAAIGPSAGWVSFWSYGGLIDYGADTPVREAFTRAASPSDTLALRENFAGCGIYVLHGDADDNVPVAQAREMRTRLAEFHTNFAYYEQPGAGHWWGDRCVDWPPMFAFFDANRRPARADHLRFVTASPAVSADFRWATILEQAEPLGPSTIDLTLDAALGTIEGTTGNVARLALRLADTRRAITRTADAGEEVEVLAPAPGESLTIRLDGDAVSVTLTSLEEPIYLTRLAGAWSLDTGPRPERKSPVRAGPFKSAFTNRAVLVYATGGDDAENAWSLAKARFDAETFKYRGNGAFEVVSDRDFLAAPPGAPLRDPDRNIVLYGNASTNLAWSAVLDGRALTLTRDAAAVGDRPRPEPDIGVLAVRPRVGSGSALVGIVGGASLAGCRATDRLPYFVSGVAYPDYTLLSPRVYETGIDGVLDAGFFAGDWSAGDDP